MSTKILLSISLIALGSCAYRSMNKTIKIPEGTYKGQFVRSSPLARYAASNVVITFTGSTFSGKSDKLNYPTICEGTFNINGKDIEFVNGCSMTADFDWSYMLMGKFEFSLAEGKLEMTKSMGDTINYYSLKLQ